MWRRGFPHHRGCLRGVANQQLFSTAPPVLSATIRGGMAYDTNTPSATAPKTPVVLLVDLDAFFVSVERLDDPRLVGVPLVVAGEGPRSVVAAASYEARSYGIHSAMPLSVARRRFSSLVVRPPRHARYREVSEQVFDTVAGFAADLERASIDEAYLTVPPHTDPSRTAHRIQAAVRDRHGISCSVGGASNKLMAKIACETVKPGGVRVMSPHQELPLLLALDVGDVPGIGAATAARLAELGVETVADLAELPEDELLERFGPARGGWLYAVARNELFDPVNSTPSPTKSISLAETYPTDLTTSAEMAAALEDLAARLWLRIIDDGRTPSTFTVTARTSDFVTRSRSTTPAAPPRSSAELAQLAHRLLDDLDVAQPMRLLGLSAERFRTVTQATLPFPDEDGFVPGQEVYHAKFGRGRVLDLTSDSALVRFDDGSQLSILKEFLRPA